MKLEFYNKSIGYIGDIHGDFQKLLEIIKRFNNTVFIICGDCGFGFHDTGIVKIKSMIKKNFTEFLKKRDIHLIFIRGNHDDPTWFQDRTFRDEINTDNFILVPDYTLLTIDDKKILCIGGAVSPDRKLRTTDSSYWLKEEMIEPIPLLNNYNIDIICAHTIDRSLINHELPSMPEWLKRSFSEDKKLMVDVQRECKICEQLLDIYTPKYWIHGHYHQTIRTEYKDTKIISLNINELYEIK